MDPMLANGTVAPIGVNDYRALDVIGWDIALWQVVPEPAGAGLLVLALAGLAAGRLRLRPVSPTSARTFPG